MLDGRREHAARQAERAEIELVGRSIALPIWVQLTRSRLRKTGMPGNQAKVELTR